MLVTYPGVVAQLLLSWYIPGSTVLDTRVSSFDPWKLKSRAQPIVGADELCTSHQGVSISITASEMVQAIGA